MASIGKAIGTLVLSMTAIVAADYIKPWVAVMLPPHGFPLPSAVVAPQPTPPVTPTPAEAVPPRPAPQTQAEQASKQVHSPPPVKRSNKRAKTRKPIARQSVVSRPRTVPESQERWQPSQRVAPRDPPMIQPEQAEQPNGETAPDCGNDWQDEPCDARRQLSPAWVNAPPPPAWPRQVVRELALPPPDWIPPPRGWREWRGPHYRFDPGRFHRRWERQWRRERW